MKNAENKVAISNFEEAKIKLELEKGLYEKKVIVNAGLLKAGKSTLFNALAGKKIFASDVVRATTENSKIELEKYFLMDTPGLDAVDKDTQTALEGYKMADAILFVHNMQDGELNQVEIDSIRQIYSLFNKESDFFENSLLVLTHKDQVMVSHEDIVRRIEEQCESIFENKFNGYLCVDSIGYLKGLEEKKELLKKESGIPELLNTIDERLLKTASLQEAHFEKNKKELLMKMEEALNGLRDEMPKTEVSMISDMKKAETEIKQILSQAVEQIQEKNMSFHISRSSYYKSFGKSKDYKEYSSESSARSAGKEAISNAINRIANEARKNALNVVSKADSYISLSGAPKEIVDELSESYEKIRYCAQKHGIAINTNFSVILRNPKEKKNISKLEKANEELRQVRDIAKYVGTGDFHSASYYAENYSSNLYIDYRYSEELVTGLFGKTKWKSITKYSYDASGAIEDIGSDAEDVVDEITDKARDAVSSAFNMLKTDLEEQFTDLKNKILAEISEQIQSQKKKEETYEKKKMEVQKQIDELQSCIRNVEAIKW